MYDKDVKIEDIDDILRVMYSHPTHWSKSLLTGRSNRGLKIEMLQDTCVTDDSFARQDTTIIDIDKSWHDEPVITRQSISQRSVSAPIRSSLRGSHAFERASTVDWHGRQRHSEKLRRDLNQFKLFNLSTATTAETIRDSMIAAEIPVLA